MKHLIGKKMILGRKEIVLNDGFTVKRFSREIPQYWSIVENFMKTGQNGIKEEELKFIQDGIE